MLLTERLVPSTLASAWERMVGVPRRPQCCVVGVGETDYSRNSGRSPLRLAVEAVRAAAEDAGVDLSAIDGIMPNQFGPRAEDLIGALGLPDVRWTAQVPLGGASVVAGLGTASAAVAAGLCRVVLLYFSKNGASQSRIGTRARAIVPGQQFRTLWEEPYGLQTPAQWYALMCRRHMHEFGTTREQLGHVALTMRDNAQRNPAAQMYGRPMTMEQYLESRPIAAPYHLLDCCLETDGATAILVCAAEQAQDLAQPAVYVAGVAEGRPSSPDDLTNRFDLTESGLRRAAPRAFAAAGMTVADIDCAMVYDCFTFEVIQQLEDAGFCGRGEGGPFVESGGIARGGRLPVNPHGGLLSAAHMGGYNHVVEAVRQLRRQAGDRQLDRVDRVAVTGWGDLGDGSLAVLTSEAAR